MYIISFQGWGNSALDLRVANGILVDWFLGRQNKAGAFSGGVLGDI